MRPPSMIEVARKLSKVPLAPGQWPCPSCWGVHCVACKRKGFVAKSDFHRWYRKLEERYSERVEALKDDLDERGKRIVGKDYFDLRWIQRMLASRRIAL